MLIPIDRPLIDARNIRPAATQTITGNDAIAHNNRPAVHLTINNAGDNTCTIANGTVVGQTLFLFIVARTAGEIIIADSGNASLHGKWYRPYVGMSLLLGWDGSSWVELDRSPSYEVSMGHGATGQFSNCFGYDGHAQGDYSTHFGSYGAASGNYSFHSGTFGVASGVGAACLETLGVASGDNATHLGDRGTVAGKRGTHLGYYGIASAYQAVHMGRYGVADQKNQLAHGGNKFEVVGDAQYSRFVLREQITHSDANWHTLGIGTSSIGPVIPSAGVWAFEAQIVGSVGNQTKVFGYTVSGVLSNTYGTITLQPSDPIAATVLYESDSDFACQAVADDTNKALSIQVKDATSGGDLVRWVATVHLTQVMYEVEE